MVTPNEESSPDAGAVRLSLVTVFLLSGQG